MIGIAPLYIRDTVGNSLACCPSGIINVMKFTFNPRMAYALLGRFAQKPGRSRACFALPVWVLTGTIPPLAAKRPATAAPRETPQDREAKTQALNRRPFRKESWVP